MKKAALFLFVFSLLFATVATDSYCGMLTWKGYSWSGPGIWVDEYDNLHTQPSSAAILNAFWGASLVGKDVWVRASFREIGNWQGTRFSIYGLRDYLGATHYAAAEVGGLHGSSFYMSRYYHDPTGMGSDMKYKYSNVPKVVTTPPQVHTVAINLKPNGWMDAWIDNALFWSTEHDSRFTQPGLIETLRFIHLNYGVYTDFKIEGMEATPEPATIVLLLSGLLLMVYFLRKRQIRTRGALSSVQG